MSKWDSATWVTIAIGLTAISTSIWAARQWGDRRGRLVFAFEYVRLLPEDGGRGLLTVSYRDIEVDNPYLLSLRLENVGSRDIPSTRFDGSKPIEIHLGATVFGLIRPPSSGARKIEVMSTAIGSTAPLTVRPQLIGKGDTWIGDVLVSGQPAPTLQHSLVDVDIVEGERTSSAVAFELAAEILPGSGLVRAIAHVASVIAGSRR